MTFKYMPSGLCHSLQPIAAAVSHQLDKYNQQNIKEGDYRNFQNLP